MNASTPDGDRRGDRRGISTVLDVAVCLLFVTASVGVLVAVDRPTADESETADRGASLLGTTTATVPYASPGGGVAAGQPPARVCQRTREADRAADCRMAHGSVAELLARAAVVDATAADRSGWPPSRFERGVRNATRQRLGGLAAEWQVVVTWSAYPGAPLSGRVVVGGEPPPSTDTHAATLRVSVTDGGPTKDGVDGTAVEVVADRTAEAAVERLFPPERTRLALAGGSPIDRATAAGYRRTATVLGADLGGTVDAAATERANAVLVAALSSRYERDLNDRVDGPVAAAELVSIDTATVTVRTWST